MLRLLQLDYRQWRQQEEEEALLTLITCSTTSNRASRPCASMKVAALVKSNNKNHALVSVCLCFMPELRNPHVLYLEVHDHSTLASGNKQNRVCVCQLTAESSSQPAVTWHIINHTNKLRPAYWIK